MTTRLRLIPLVATLLALDACHGPSENPLPTLARFLLEADEGRGSLVTLPTSGVRIAVSPKPVISEFDIVDVELAQVELGRCLMFRLTPAAARDLYRLTASSQGRRLVLTLNGTAIGARRIEHPFEDGTVLIFVELPDGELPALVQHLKKTSADLRRAAARAA